VATTHLLLRTVADFKGHDVFNLLRRVREVGKQLVKAQPREVVIENIIRRVLGLIREVSSPDFDGENDTNSMSDADSLAPSQDSPPRGASSYPDPHGDFGISLNGTSQPKRPTLVRSSTTSAPALASSTTSLFWFFPQNQPDSQSSTPLIRSPAIGALQQNKSAIMNNQDVKSIKLDAIDGIKEILDEIDQASEQVADNALTYINSNDTILVQGGSSTIYQFLYAAASKKRKFTVFVVDGSPNNFTYTRNQLLTGSNNISPLAQDDESKQAHDYNLKPLVALGINVVLIPDTAVFAIMSYVNKVLLAPNAVLSSGGLLAPAGASSIAAAAQAHKVPVLSLSGIYKLSPKTSVDPMMLREIGDAGALGGSEDLWDDIEVLNPLWDLVQPEKVNLYITNLYVFIFLLPVIFQH
jgi:translation initiation factor eIF-2B subunit beta